jgi:hypothetical protein
VFTGALIRSERARSQWQERSRACESAFVRAFRPNPVNKPNGFPFDMVEVW